jgi:hypothetical protein
MIVFVHPSFIQLINVYSRHQREIKNEDSTHTLRDTTTILISMSL